MLALAAAPRIVNERLLKYHIHSSLHNRSGLAPSRSALPLYDAELGPGKRDSSLELKPPPSVDAARPRPPEGVQNPIHWPYVVAFILFSLRGEVFWPCLNPASTWVSIVPVLLKGRVYKRVQMLTEKLTRKGFNAGYIERPIENGLWKGFFLIGS